MEKLKDLLSIELLRESDTQIKISGVVPAKLIEEERAKIIEDSKKNMQMDGFRKGNLPTEEAEKRLDEMYVWNEGARRVIQEVFPSILEEYELNPLGPPKLSFVKTAIQTDVEFNLSFPVLPKVELPDYKEIAKKSKPKDKVVVDEKEIETALKDLRKGLYMRDNPKEKVPEDIEKLPEITDDVVKGLSSNCKNVDDFKEYLKKGILKQKQEKAISERRQGIIDEITEKVDLKIPDDLIEPEVKSLWGNLEKDLEKGNITLEDHLKKIGKTKEELRSLIKEDSRKRAKIQLILNQIAIEENISVDEAVLTEEFQKFKETNKPGIPDEQAKIWLTTIMTNEKVFSYLENLYKEI